MTNGESIEPTHISRRNFLRMTGIFLLGSLLIRDDNYEIKQAFLDLSRERIARTNSALFLDFFASPREIYQLAEQHTGIRYDPTQLAKFLQKGILSSNQFLTYLPKHPEDLMLAKMGVIKMAGALFSTHGEEVASSYKIMLRHLGYIDPYTQKVSIHNLARKVEFVTDEEGIALRLELDPEAIKTELRKHPNRRMVNFSFMTGEIEVKISLNELIPSTSYPDHPTNKYKTSRAIIASRIGTSETVTIRDPSTGETISEDEFNLKVAEFEKQHPDRWEPLPAAIYEIRDSYSSFYAQKRILQQNTAISSPEALELAKQKVADNFSQLIDICHEFPSTTFFCAAGNNANDLEFLREHFKDRWPTNLISVGQLSRIRDGGYINPNDTWGADIYAVNRDFVPRNHSGSSNATPVIMALSQALTPGRVELSSLLQALHSLCNQVVLPRFTWQAQETTSQVYVLSPGKIKNHFGITAFDIPRD